MTRIDDRRIILVATARRKPDAPHVRLRARLMMVLLEHLQDQSGTQSRKASALGISQPRLNDLLRGRIERFSLDTLVDLAFKLGYWVRLNIGTGAPPREFVVRRSRGSRAENR